MVTASGLANPIVVTSRTVSAIRPWNVPDSAIGSAGPPLESAGCRRREHGAEPRRPKGASPHGPPEPRSGTGRRSCRTRPFFERSRHVPARRRRPPGRLRRPNRRRARVRRAGFMSESGSREGQKPFRRVVGCCRPISAVEPVRGLCSSRDTVQVVLQTGGMMQAVVVTGASSGIGRATALRWLAMVRLCWRLDASCRRSRSSAQRSSRERPVSSHL